MKRVDHTTKSTDLFGTGKHGFRSGTPGVNAPTVVQASWLNSVQEEIARAVESSSAALDGDYYAQLAPMLAGRREIDAFLNINDTAPAAVSIPAANTVHAFACNEAGRIVAVGANGEAHYSDDLGASWSNCTVGGGYAGTFNAAIWSGSYFVIVGSGGEIQRSAAGATFTEISSTFNGSSDLTGIARNASGRLVVCGANGTTGYSDDNGGTWNVNTDLNGGTYSSFGIACDNDVFIVTGNPGAADPTKACYRSTNGSSWSVVDLSALLGTYETLQDIAGQYQDSGQNRIAPGFIAHVFDTNDSTRKAIYSADGSTWAEGVDITSTSTRRFFIGRGCIVLRLTASGLAYCSYDGRNWFSQWMPGVTDLQYGRMIQMAGMGFWMLGPSGGSAGDVLRSNFLAR